jgi:hypothetical protein
LNFDNINNNIKNINHNDENLNKDDNNNNKILELNNLEDLNNINNNNNNIKKDENLNNFNEEKKPSNNNLNFEKNEIDNEFINEDENEISIDSDIEINEEYSEKTVYYTKRYFDGVICLYGCKFNCHILIINQNIHLKFNLIFGESKFFKSFLEKFFGFFKKILMDKNFI